MTEQIIIAGAGGQGIMLLGKVIASAALYGKKNVTWLPSYGAEVRGGTANCMVVICDEEIASPYIDKPDSLIIMNEPSMLKFIQRIKSKGLILINSSLVPAPKTKNANNVYLPFTETAIGLGDIKVANVIALGAYIKKRKILNKQAVFSAIEEIAPAEKRNLIQINKQAIEKGMKLVNDAS